MQAQRKTVAFLLPGMLLFFGLTIVLFRTPAQYPLIVLLYFAFVMATSFAISMEMAAVYAVFVTLIELVAVNFLHGYDKGWMIGQIVFMWSALYIANRYSSRDQ